MNLCRIICLMLTLPLWIMEILGVYGMYKRVFPFLAYHITFSYNEKMHTVKRDLFRNIYKFTNEDNTLRLLEIGCGSGANFPFYPHGCTVTCTDPNPHFEKYLQRSMEANKHLTYERFLVMCGEDMGGLADRSVDVVVCTLVLCSVHNVQRVLEEARRVLKTASIYTGGHVCSGFAGSLVWIVSWFHLALYSYLVNVSNANTVSDDLYRAVLFRDANL